MSDLILLPTDSADARFTTDCAHREVNNRDPQLASLPRRENDPDTQMRIDEGLAHEEWVFAELRRMHKVANLRDDDDVEDATTQAMMRGDAIIVGPQLPTINNRAGRPDVLLRHGNAPMSNGKWAYLPVDVKHSKALTGEAKPRTWSVSTLESPWFSTAVETEVGKGTPEKNHDLQLVHYWMMLTDLGHAPDIDPTGGIIDRECRIVWRRLDDGRKPALETWQTEWIARWEAILALREGRTPLTRPILHTNCGTCSWRDVCDDALVAEQHVSLLPGLGLDQTAKLAAFGIETIPQLASADQSLVGTDKLPAYSNLSRDIDAARVHLHGGNRPFLRRGTATPRIPRADIEIDFDMENDDVLYLLGNWITHRQPDGSYTAGEYKSFHFFDRSDPAEEGRQLAAFWAWLHGMVDDARAAGKTIALYCYSGATAEITQMKAASLRNSDVPGVPTPEQIADLVHQPWWVDLLPVAKSFHWPARGHGLKELAKLTGFSWNADDASGGQSMVWYRAACDPLNPEAEDLQRKLLQYNTDDVRATLHLRNYLCEGIEGNSWTIHPVEVLPLS